MSSTLSLFQHPGNKGKLKAHILPRLQEQLKDSSIEVYCEPFLGSASLCLAFLAMQPEIKKLLLNDRDIGIASLWTSVIQFPDALIERVYEFKPTVEAFHRLKEFLSVRKVSGGHEGMIDIGFANLAIHQLSYGGRGTMAAGALGGWAQEKVDRRSSGCEF